MGRKEIRLSMGCLLLACAPIFAEELDLRTDAETVPELLVLKTGRVVRGELFPRPGGYDVRLTAGRMFVPDQQVRFVAGSMDDAYHHMRDSVAELTPDSHLALARWCLTNHLPGRARREILDALHLDPFRDDARKMLEDLTRQQRQSISVSQTSHSELSRHELETPGVIPNRRSLGGLPSDLAQTFTRRIQPLISNKCGNSSCHGAGRNSFVVTPLRSGSTPALAEQNLAAILGQLDLQQLENSPLLKATEELHGGLRRPLFSGRTGRMQTQMLRSWVMKAGRELGDGTPIRLPSSDAPALKSRSAGVPATTQVPHSTEVETPGDARFLRDAAESTRPDAFDPGSFNLKYHGAPYTPKTPLTAGLKDSAPMQP